MDEEKDKLLVFTAALLAERRLKRGLKLNHPEAIAWLSFLVLEGARDGKCVSDLMAEGTIEEKIVKALNNKIDLASQVMGEEPRKILFV